MLKSTSEFNGLVMSKPSQHLAGALAYDARVAADTSACFFTWQSVCVAISTQLQRIHEKREAASDTKVVVV
jgi:hypothetical protein